MRRRSASVAVACRSIRVQSFDRSIRPIAIAAMTRANPMSAKVAPSAVTRGQTMFATARMTMTARLIRLDDVRASIASTVRLSHRVDRPSVAATAAKARPPSSPRTAHSSRAARPGRN
ncbi:hypothetical protein CXR29_12580 [Brevibacterium linens]|nr:hypothetical protein CXR29_12580 [Brevibacterium linens]